MSSSTSALKATKSIVDSYVSSTERSDLTTSFTEHSISSSASKTNVNTNIIQRILGVVKHPKFKWMVIAVLLCVCVFVYFKSQNKQTKNKEQIEDTRDAKLDVIDGRPTLVNNDKEKEYMDKMAQLQQKEKQLLEKMNQMNQMNNQRAQLIAQQVAQQEAQLLAQRAQHEAQKVQQESQRPQPQTEANRARQNVINRAPPRESMDSESSEEVFIENENVMNHNLTRDEMNAIDKQLEDINIDEMGYESD